MAGSRKKVVVRMEDGTVQVGYMPASGVVNRQTNEVELLDVAGRLVGIALKDLRYVAYVRDFNLDDRTMPERLVRKTFLARPRTVGLWCGSHFATAMCWKDWRSRTKLSLATLWPIRESTSCHRILGRIRSGCLYHDARWGR